MSAPQGFNPEASMLPAGGGAIQPMKGGGGIEIELLIKAIVKKFTDNKANMVGKDIILNGGGLKRKTLKKKRVRFTIAQTL